MPRIEPLKCLSRFPGYFPRVFPIGVIGEVVFPFKEVVRSFCGFVIFVVNFFFGLQEQELK